MGGSARDLGRRSGGLSATRACGEQIFSQMSYVLVTYVSCLHPLILRPPLPLLASLIWNAAMGKASGVGRK